MHTVCRPLIILSKLDRDCRIKGVGIRCKYSASRFENFSAIACPLLLANPSYDIMRKLDYLHREKGVLNKKRH